VKKSKNNNGDNMENNSPKIVKYDKKQVEELLKSAMQDFLIRKSSVAQEKTKNVNNLISQITEFLSAFIIIGYDVSGEPVNIIHATNQMDADALSAAINKFILHSINGSSEK
jgi:hypothetical protein